MTDKYRLYNPGRGPLPVALRDGTSTSIPGKGELIVEAGLMGSGDIAQKKRKKLLHVSPVREDPPAPEPPPSPPKPQAKPAKVEKSSKTKGSSKDDKTTGKSPAATVIGALAVVAEQDAQGVADKSKAETAEKDSSSGKKTGGRSS